MNQDRKSILITGCSSGIGHHCAHGLQKRGWRVFAGARKAEDVQRLKDEGLEALPLDLDDSASIAAAVDLVLERSGGRLDALFNNAGYGQPGAVEDLSRATLRAQFESNVFGTLELTNRIIPLMRAQGQGRIVQNSSVLGFVALPYRGAYNASKYALEGLYDTLRLELAGSGIHCVLIEPGPIESRFREHAYAMFRRHIDAEHSVHRERYAAMVRRLTRPGPAAPFTLGPDAVLKKLLHALESPRPRPRYYVTFPTWLFGTLKRLLGSRALDRVLLGVSRGEHRA
ncbi:SDR family oxidoreductase [Thiohalobacter sp. IOR34]|uniref:SDR family oxidoreductase n=1 Tax=Thiohalobacter sp. IOR34 TaxID=3057176 RepID=UPI0025B0286B|nr:SDR family oxidoreductase [Thiohalobacter sp. IOR34]WJW74975.1 SDR family oxidoreductase [Thiohalobacter sp. IOR34]